jgi:hypothetical protein
LTNYASNPLVHEEVRTKMLRNGHLRAFSLIVAAFLACGILLPAQTQPAYQPKFPGDPAHSDSEAQALGYMRVVIRAQKTYKKRHDKYAASLVELGGTESFTKRMARSTDRGDYTIGFRSHKDGYILTATPKQIDENHRSFYAEEDGIIHADDQKAADSNSPRLK